MAHGDAGESSQQEHQPRKVYYDPARNAAQQYVEQRQTQQGTGDARTEQPFDPAQNHRDWNAMMSQTMGVPGQPRERTYGQLLIGNEYRTPSDSTQQPRTHKPKNSGNSKKYR